MARFRTATMLGGLAVVVGALSTTTGVVPVAAKEPVVVMAAKGELPPTVMHTGKVDRTMPAISAGTLQSASEALAAQSAANAGRARVNTPGGTNSENGSGAPSQSLGAVPNALGCSDRNTNGDVRVNQDCSYRRQAEEIIKFNPADPSNLVAGQNDSRIGYNHCGFDYSFNSGQTWGDGLPPYWQHANQPLAQGPTASDPNRHTIAGGPGTNHTYDFASDPNVAFDSSGRAFFGCAVLDVFSNASGLLVTQSPQGAGGSFYDNVPAFGGTFVVVEDNSPSVLHDKPFITADIYKNSPNRDNVYATWTVFRFNSTGGYQESPIFGSMSTDHALTWSTPEEISGTSDALCFFGNFFNPSLPGNACNFDQGSDPIVLPNGDLQVIFNNGNTAANNPNAQQLGVHCHPTGSSPAGTARLNCSAPSKVGDDIVVGEPLCNFGRGPEECIPGAYIRTNDFPRIAVNRGTATLYAAWQDYRNQQFDIQLAQSTDGGLTWTDATNSVNPDPGKDHYFPAIDIVPGSSSERQRSSAEGNGNNGATDHVAVSYYRTDRVPNENTTPPPFAPGQPGVQAENSDYVLAGGQGLDTPYAFTRVSPEFPPPDGIQAGFNGDYSGLTVVGDIAHPIWSDTRSSVPAFINAQPPGQGVQRDEDIFTTARPVPSGHGEQG